jgi:hypothetical protein
MALTPLLLGIYLFAIAHGHNDRILYEIVSANIGVLIILFGTWGVFRLSHSVTEELADSTWDWQRLSPVSSLELVAGKFVGSAIYQHYAVFVLFIYWGLFSAVFALDSYYQPTAYPTMFLHLCFLLALQAAALLGSILQCRSRSKTQQRRTSNRALSFFIPGCVVGVIAYSMLFVGLYQAAKRGEIYSLWYRLDSQHASIFAVLSFLTLFFCAFAGAVRSMRTELQVKQIPWGVSAFSIILGLYSSGFIDPKKTPDVLSYTLLVVGSCFFIAALCCFFAALFTDTNQVQLKKFYEAINVRALLKCLQLMPSWIFPLALTTAYAVLIALLCCMLSFSGGVEEASASRLFDVLGKPVYITAYCFSLLAYLVREILIMLYIDTRYSNEQTASRMKLFYYFCAYLFIPVLCLIVGLTELSVIVAPWNLTSVVTKYTLVVPFGIFVEAAIVAFLFVRAFSQRHKLGFAV